MEFHIGDKVRLVGDDLSQPFEIRQITKGGSTILYAGEHTPWYPEDKLDYFLTEDEGEQRNRYERLVHNTKADLAELKRAGDVLSKAPMPEWFKRWFYKELGVIMGWEQDLR